MENTIGDEIAAIIKPWMKSSAKPPPTIAELVVIVILLNPRMRMSSVKKWIFSMFEYYNRIAIASFVSSEPRHGFQRTRAMTLQGDAIAVVTEIEEAFGSFSAPIENCELHHGEPHYVVNAAEGRIFLQKYLPTKAKSDRAAQAFPFMRLPAELRLNIFALVLGFPRSGMRLQYSKRWVPWSRKGRDPAITTIMRSYDEQPDLFTWFDAIGGFRKNRNGVGQFGNKVLNCGLLHSTLSLLLVSKQVFAEAMPVFYSINSFICGDTDELATLLERTSKARRNHIAHISFRYEPRTQRSACHAFRLLKGLTRLRQLDVTINKDQWSGHVTKIPGLPTLRGVRGLHRVTFHGDCDALNTTFPPEMTKSRAVGGLKGPRKRKANAEGEKSRKSTAKKAREI